MNIRLSLLYVLAGLALAATHVQAESLVNGSAEAGKARALTCGACHGAEGVSSNPMWPNLAGQNAPYVLAQLKAFKDGDRKDPLMSAQAMMLSDEDMANLAVYFESLPAAAQAVADENLLDRGQSLYRGGNLEDKTSACLACHGPTGRGNPAAAYPALRGQHAAYTAKQLNDYRDGARTTGSKVHMMQDIAANLDKADIAALSSYVQGLK
ncbi:MAG: cytochrome c4 [Gammaproteobacteria bacterium]|jgi:cytochrome c553|nr:cytochrome c4 [Gammaproteobacteria bacterium]MDH5241309.1 cytochrome c4 [Gammaproteobacteria bacterium]MDH5261354.1 cytochrome c4 [Gammaproteobacteria bacterium]MDH5583493.1 cytochrome c4 [Gammaproteobacteria bacterium]